MRIALGILLGRNKVKKSSIVTTADAFKARVEARSGTFEAKPCLNTQLRAINKIA